MARVLIRITARRDLTDHFVFFGENASVEVARRFLDSSNSTFQELAQMPEIGVSRTFRNSKYASVRMWPVKGFDKYLVFYRALEDGIEVLRVIHGARDIERIFG